MEQINNFSSLGLIVAFTAPIIAILYQIGFFGKIINTLKSLFRK